MFNYFIPTNVIILGIGLFSFTSIGEVDALDLFKPNGFHVAVPSSFERTTEKHEYPHPLRRPKIKESKPAIIESTEDTLLAPYYPRDTIFDEKYKPWGGASLPSNPPNQVVLDKIDDDLFDEKSEIHSYDQTKHGDTRNRVW